MGAVVDDHEWRALDLWDSSDCSSHHGSHSLSSSHCSSHSLSSMEEEAHDTPMPAPRVSFCATLDAPPTAPWNSPPGSPVKRAKGVLKAPRYKACQVRMQLNLETSGMMSTMSMDLSLSVGSSDEDLSLHSSDCSSGEDDEGEGGDWQELSYGSNASDDDGSVAIVDGEDDESVASAELQMRGEDSGQRYSDYGANDSMLLYANGNGDKDYLNQGNAAAGQGCSDCGANDSMLLYTNDGKDKDVLSNATSFTYMSSNSPSPPRRRRPGTDDTTHRPQHRRSAAAAAVADLSRSMDDICRGVRRRFGAQVHARETPVDCWRSVDEINHGHQGEYGERGLHRPHVQPRKKRGLGRGWKALVRAFPRRKRQRTEDKDKETRRRGEDSGDSTLDHTSVTSSARSSIRLGISPCRASAEEGGRDHLPLFAMGAM